MIVDCFCIDEESPDNRWVAVFEDDGEAGTLYLCKRDCNGDVEMITDGLRIYNKISPPIEERKSVFLIWSKDSSKAAIIIDEMCYGMFDIHSKRKLAAKKVDDINSIPLSTWEDGIEFNSGESLCTDKEFDYQASKIKAK